MALAYPLQRFQDWFTQQWVILWGRRFEPKDHPWLIGPFGDLNGTGIDFVTKLAEAEGLIIERENRSRGLIPSTDSLDLSPQESAALSPHVARFYTNTADFELNLSVKWNPFFRPFGILLNWLFSNRLDQLNIPTKDGKNAGAIASEIITLIDPLSQSVKYTIWLRTSETTGQTVYAGAYGTCRFPSGKVCIKAVFPLPNGNATVILSPRIGENGELILESSGKRFGDAGFYFLLIDSKGNHWAQFIRSFRDRLSVFPKNGHLRAEQTLTLWHLTVVKFTYEIREKETGIDTDLVAGNRIPQS